MDGEPIAFLASFPDIQSAIKTGKDGARVQLDVPASEMAAIVRLVAIQARPQVLRVTITVEESKGNHGSSTPPTGTARRPTDVAGR